MNEKTWRRSVHPFSLNGKEYKHDGHLPDEIFATNEHLKDLFNKEGIWKDGYPESLSLEKKDPQDELPTALYNIKRIGGTIIEVHPGPDGAIHWEDWERPIIY